MLRHFCDFASQRLATQQHRNIRFRELLGPHNPQQKHSTSHQQQKQQGININRNKRKSREE
jgi:hypothetical protein